MTSVIHSLVYAVLAAIIIHENEPLSFPKRTNTYNLRERGLDPRKRPFCNAFTGCGRKRSNIPAISTQGEDIEDSIGSLLELSEEPAVEDLSRQIMSEAKLWEAIQEANVELNRRRQKTGVDDDFEVVGPAKSATASCALPPCYI